MSTSGARVGFRPTNAPSIPARPRRAARLPHPCRPYPALPSFIADSPQESKPYGRWQERLREELATACEPHADEAGAPLDPETIRWFPERTWGGRVYMPATGLAAEADDGGEAQRRDEESETPAVEYFGWVSFERPDDGEPHDLRASADFTDVTAEANPEWRIDLKDDVIGKWSAEGDRGETSRSCGVCRWCAAPWRPPPSSTGRSWTRPR